MVSFPDERNIFSGSSYFVPSDEEKEQKSDTDQLFAAAVVRLLCVIDP